MRTFIALAAVVLLTGCLSKSKDMTADEFKALCVCVGGEIEESDSELACLRIPQA